IFLLHVLAVISLEIGQTKKPLLEDRILPVPQRDGKTEPALAVADAQQPVFPPAIRPAASVIVGEVIPAIAVGGIILADRAPLPLGQVRSPPLPVFLPPRVLAKTLMFGRIRRWTRGH